MRIIGGGFKLTAGITLAQASHSHMHSCYTWAARLPLCLLSAGRRTCILSMHTLLPLKLSPKTVRRSRVALCAGAGRCGGLPRGPHGSSYYVEQDRLPSVRSLLNLSASHHNLSGSHHNLSGSHHSSSTAVPAWTTWKQLLCRTAAGSLLCSCPVQPQQAGVAAAAGAAVAAASGAPRARF